MHFCVQPLFFFTDYRWIWRRPVLNPLVALHVVDDVPDGEQKQERYRGRCWTILHTQFSLFLPVLLCRRICITIFPSVSVSYCTDLVDITFKQKLAL